MASPMRKKRAWSTPEDDAQVKESAAFEASVAAAQDTAAKSGAFLSSAKEDLTDHQRWLRAQSVAVERDRQRHEKWLQRQRDKEHAAMRKERVRRRRLLMRQRALQAVQQAFIDVIDFIRSWIAFVFGSITGGFKAAGLAVGQGVAAVGRAIAHGVSGIGVKLAAAARQLGSGLSAGAAWGGAKVRGSARAGSAAVAAGSSAVASEAGKLSNVAGSSLGKGFASARAKGSHIASQTGRAAGRGGVAVAAQISAFGASAGRGLSGLHVWGKSQVAAIPPALYVQLARVSHNIQRFTQTRTPGAPSPPSDTQPGVEASVHIIEVYGPHEEGVALFGRSANEPWDRADPIDPTGPTAPTDPTGPTDPLGEPDGSEVYGPLEEGFLSGGVSPNEPRSPSSAPDDPAKASNSLAVFARACAARAAAFGSGVGVAAGSAWVALQTGAVRTGRWAKSSSWANTDVLARAKNRAEAWAQTRGLDLSQMMIIAGAVLLVCGGLLVGGGLLMRAGAKGPLMAGAQEETFSGITWTFNEPDLPLPDRAVFTLSGTPESFLINGLSISGVNNTGRPLAAVQGVLKPDVQRPDLKLSLAVDGPQRPGGDDGEETEGEAVTVSVVPADTVPAQTPFRLVFAFPPEVMDGADGITVEDFFETYGGLFLTLRYTVDGIEKSVFQYLAPDMLKAQLEEVSAYAGGS